MDMVSHNQQQPTNPWIDWVVVVLFGVSGHIQGYYMYCLVAYCYVQAQKQVFENVNYTKNWTSDLVDMDRSESSDH
jgi:hypothetical protein